METIIALATPPLQSALALIRVCGDEAFSITEKLLGKPLKGLEARTSFHGTLSYQGKAIDDVILLCYPANHSMNGEDMVEISCHGSMVIANEIIEAYLSSGARYAVNGEFTSRAFYHGKIDLVQAEAINDLINASTKESKNVALLSLSGKTSALLAPLLEEIGAMVAKLEVGIDYPEYDEEEAFTQKDLSLLSEKLLARLEGLLKDATQGHYVRNGIDVAIVGEPNVGKSSLLNALLEEDKAIVSPIPGTTRDVVEGTISIHGLPVRLFDTAGIRETEDVIEKLGVKRSQKALDQAELVLLVVDEQSKNSAQTNELRSLLQGKRVLEVHNKSDLSKENDENLLRSSAIKGEVQDVKEAIFRALSLTKEAFEQPSLSSEREIALLRNARQNILEAKSLCDENVTLDLVAVPLQKAYNDIRAVLGLDATQDFSAEIFSRFCVGK